jgi:hypothetical protein
VAGATNAAGRQHGCGWLGVIVMVTAVVMLSAVLVSFVEVEWAAEVEGEVRGTSVQLLTHSTAHAILSGWVLSCLHFLPCGRLPFGSCSVRVGLQSCFGSGIVTQLCCSTAHAALCDRSVDLWS